MRGRIEIPVEVAGIVQHPHIEVVRRLPLNQRQQALRIAFQDAAVFVDLFENGGGDREDDARRIEPALGQAMMNEITMQTPVTVIDGMAIDKPEPQPGTNKPRAPPSCGAAAKTTQNIHTP